MNVVSCMCCARSGSDHLLSMIVRCGHTFHTDCLNALLLMQSNSGGGGGGRVCPLCPPTAINSRASVVPQIGRPIGPRLALQAAAVNSINRMPRLQQQNAQSMATGPMALLMLSMEAIRQNPPSALGRNVQLHLADGQRSEHRTPVAAAAAATAVHDVVELLKQQAKRIEAQEAIIAELRLTAQRIPQLEQELHESRRNVENSARTIADLRAKLAMPAMTTDATSARIELPKTSAIPESKATVNLRVWDMIQNAIVAQYKIRKNAGLGKLMDTHCQRESLDRQQVEFTFGGQLIQATDTADSLRMENGALIEMS